MADEVPITDAGQDQAAEHAEGLVPGWLAIAVLLLMLAVAALGGFLVRGLLVNDRPGPRTPSQYAVAEWQRQVDADPSDPDALIGLGYAFQEEGRYEEALAAYAAALELAPGNTGALYNSGIVYLELGRGAEAEATLWDVLEVAPDHVLAAKALGEYYTAKGQYKSALVALEPVIEVRPQYADLQYLAGNACEQLGITDTAIEYYRGALTYHPDHLESREALDRLGARE